MQRSKNISLSWMYIRINKTNDAFCAFGPEVIGIGNKALLSQFFSAAPVQIHELKVYLWNYETQFKVNLPLAVLSLC